MRIVETIQDPTIRLQGNDKNGKNAGIVYYMLVLQNDTAKGQEYIYARNDDKEDLIHLLHIKQLMEQNSI